MKKVAIIGTVGVPAKYGGYETLVENLVSKKINNQICYTVYCSSKAYQSKYTNYYGAKLIYIPLRANGWQALPYDTLSIIHAYFTSDIILSLGTVGCYVLPLLKLFSQKRVIVNLDGLDNKRSKWGSFSKLIIGSARRIAAKFADVRISDNEAIVDYVRNVYHKNSVLIEYGGDNAKPVYDEQMLLHEYGLTPGGYAFKVARIEPENNIEMILEAFSSLPDQKVVIVGNWNKGDFGRELRVRFERYSNIIMLDPEYDQQKINLLRSNCKLYIHGHSAGGTNPSLVEAMYLRLPIIAYDVEYNRSTTENRALYFYDKEQLSSLVQLAERANLDQIAQQMYSIAQRRYTWQMICEKYENLFV